MLVFRDFLVSIQSKCGKIRTRKTPITGTFREVYPRYYDLTNAVKGIQKDHIATTARFYREVFYNNPCQSVFYCSHTTTKVLLKFRDHIQRARNSRLQILYNKGVLEYFPKFTGKRLCWNLLLKVLQVLRIANIFKRSTSTGVYL